MEVSNNFKDQKQTLKKVNVAQKDITSDRDKSLARLHYKVVW
jgi:hypothetical protein